VNITESVNAPIGILQYQIYDNEQLIEVFDERNLIVLNSRIIQAKTAGGADPLLWAISKVGVGTNATAPSTADSALTSGVTVPIYEVSYPTSSSVRFHFRFDPTDAIGMNIAEFGLLSGNNTLFSRKNRTPLMKTNSISLRGTWTIIFNA